MKIAVFAQENIKYEIFHKPAGKDVSIVYVNALEDFAEISDADAYFDLEFENDDKRINGLAAFLPKPIFVNAVVNTLKQIGQPFVRINAWPGFLEREICEVVVLNETYKEYVANIFARLNWQFLYVPDISGMITARIIAMVINEAYFTLQDAVSSKEEIDTAMKLGTNYPYGPFEWTEKIGIKRVHDLISELAKTDIRYNISKALENEVFLKK
ncbi:MAG TPA: 3-hydroxyacyl-CoA dehydrogenase family protein [Puia sp.]|nr:3-hydroxyacyl-CoA dehydrogenase family protein [Puia sp.]